MQSPVVRLLLLPIVFVASLLGQSTTIPGSRILQGALNFGTESGTGNAYVVTVGVGALTPGMQISFVARHGNTGAATINVDGLGPVSLLLGDGATGLSTNAIRANSLVQAIYNGTNFQIVGATGTGAVGGPNSDLSNFFTALAGSYSTPVNVLAIGDSETRCWGNTCGNIGPTNIGSLWVERLRSYLSYRFGSHGAGIIPIQSQVYGGGTVDNHFWTLSGSYVSIVDMGPYTGSVGSLYRFQQNGAAALSSQYCDRFRIYYATGSDTGTGFAVSIDGGAQQTVGTLSSGPAVGHIVEVSAGALGNHTLTVTKTGTGAMHIYGAEPLIGNNGVSVQDVAEGACTADCWADNGGHAAEAFNDLIPGGVQLVIIALGTNEINLGTPLNTYTANYQAIITHFKNLANPPNIVLMTEPWIANNQANAASYNAAAQTLAANNGVSFFDAATDYFVSYTNEQNNSWIQADGLHLNDNAQQGWGTYVVQKIFGASQEIANPPGTTTGGSTFNGGAITTPLAINTNTSGGAQPLTITNSAVNDYSMMTLNGDQAQYSVGTANSGSGPNANQFFVFNRNSFHFPLTIDPSDNATFAYGTTTVKNLAVTGICTGCGGTTGGTSNIVVVGDSHMAGYLQTNSIPSQIQPIRPFTVNNQAISGVKVCAHFGDQGTNEAALDALYNPSARVNILVMDGDGNALIDNNTGNPAIPAVSPQQSHDCMKAFALRQKAIGWKVVLYPMYSRAQTGYNNQTGDQLHDSANALWDADWFTFADAYVPHSPDTPAVWNTGDNSGSCFQSDHIHVVSACTGPLVSNLTRAVNQAELGVGLPSGSGQSGNPTVAGNTVTGTLTINNSSPTWAEQINSSLASDFAWTTYKNDSAQYFGLGIGGSSSSKPNTFFVFNGSDFSFPLTITPDDVTHISNLNVTSCTGCGGNATFNGGTITGITTIAPPSTAGTDGNTALPLTVQSASNYSGVQLNLVNQNTGDFNWMGFKGDQKNFGMGLGNSGAPFPNTFILYDFSAGAIRFSVDGTGHTKMPQLASPTAGVKYFVCVDSNGTLNSQSTACQ